MFLTAVIDWYSRYMLSWRLSNTREARFCLEALDEALDRGRPEIFNTDQGSQFTSREYTGRWEASGVAVSRDGRGRALDNVFVERLWRSVKTDPTTTRTLHTRSRTGYNRRSDRLPLGSAGPGPLVPGSARFPRRILIMPRHPSAIAPPRP
jgi:transposase InsO family protein